MKVKEELILKKLKCKWCKRTFYVPPSVLAMDGDFYCPHCGEYTQLRVNNDR